MPTVPGSIPTVRTFLLRLLFFSFVVSSDGAGLLLLVSLDSLISVYASVHVCECMNYQGSRPTEWGWLYIPLSDCLCFVVVAEDPGFCCFVGLLNFRVNCTYVSFQACASFASSSRQTESGLILVDLT